MRANTLRDLARQRDQARAQADAATQALYRAILQAQQEGWTLTDIATDLHITKSGAQQAAIRAKAAAYRA